MNFIHYDAETFICSLMRVFNKMRERRNVTV